MILGGTYEEMLAFATNCLECTIDAETTGKHRRRNHAIGFGISGFLPGQPTRRFGFYIATHEWSFPHNEIQPTGAEAQAKTVLEALKGKKLKTWNGAFDVSVLNNTYGVDLTPWLWIDGMLMAHMVSENEFDYKLKNTAKRIFGAKAVSEEADLKAEVTARGGRWGTENKDMYMASAATLGKYCIKDNFLTDDLIAYYFPKLRAEGLEKFFLEDETMPLYREFTIPAENNGIPLDMPLITAAQQECQVEIDKLEQKILAALEPHLGIFRTWLLNKDYPPSRTGDFVQAFCRLHRVDLPLTATGKYSITARTIAASSCSPYISDVLTKKSLMVGEDVAKVQHMLWAADGSPGFNLQSKHHLKKLFFDTLKEKPLSRTKLGAPQVDDEFLDIMAKKYDWANDLRTYNRLNKLKGTYMDRFIDAAEDGRFYPSFFQHRTKTGRLAGDLQQLPRPIENPAPDDIVAKFQNQIRAFFIADKGWTIIDDDFDSAEPRVFAHVSNEPALKQVFSNGHDFYSTICLQVETAKTKGLSADKKAPNYLGKINKTWRQDAKKYALGLAYGETGYKLQFELDIPLEQADKLVIDYFKGLPNLFEEIKKTHAQALETGIVRTECGRIRHLNRAKQLYQRYGDCILNDLELWKRFNDTPGLYAEAKAHRKEFKKLLNSAFNFRVQGLVANIVNRAAIAIARRFRAECPQAKLIANIHDELVATAPVEAAEKAASIVRQEMESAWPISVPMVALPSFGQNFRDAKGA